MHPRDARRRLLAVLLVVVASGGAACSRGEDAALEGEASDRTATETAAGEPITAPTTATPPTTQFLPVSTAPEPEPIVVTADVAAELLSSVVRTQEDGSRHLVRWGDAQVRVGVEGSPTSEDLRILDESLATYSSVVPANLVRSDAAPNVVVHFATKDRWATIVDDPDIDLGPAGWTYTLSRGTSALPNVAGEISEATIVVDSTIPQVARNRVIAHELGHALGLGHTSCAGSLMSEDPDARPLWSPADLDLALLEVLYDPRIEAGMDEPAVVRLIDPSASSGPTCEPVVFQLVDVGGDTYFCVISTGAQPCTRYVGTEPTLPVLEPDGWVLEGRFADFDPTKWIEYGFEDERLLCERTSGPYQPCVVFDGTSQPTTPIADPQYWTDGSVVYDSFPG